MRVAIYIRVSTADQHTTNQRHELERYAAARGWTVTQTYDDHGISGAKETRPALDRLTADARRRTFDAVLCWKLDRLGRNLRHLLFVIDEWTALGVAFVSLAEGIDATTPAGRLQLHILGAIAQFERDRTTERIHAGIARARREGTRLGRPRKSPIASGPRVTVREAARAWHVSLATASRRLNRGEHPGMVSAGMVSAARETIPPDSPVRSARVSSRSVAAGRG
jgi:DNA invertase Pin-like site-specific DNA recombinase